MIPLHHDFSGRTVLVAGGGPVARRRATRFAGEASVLVLARSFAPGDWDDCQRVRVDLHPATVDEWVARADPALVVAATDDPAVNEALVRAARERNVMANRADRSDDAGRVTVPAVVREGPVVVSVGTSGQSPAMSRFLRGQIEETLADLGDVAGMTELTAALREELGARDVAPERRRAALAAVLRSRNVWIAFQSTGANPRQRAVDVIHDVTGEST